MRKVLREAALYFQFVGAELMVFRRKRNFHINANDLVARRWHGDCTNRNVITASTSARADIVRWPVAECAQVSMQVWPMATSRSHF